MKARPLDLSLVRVRPLAERLSLANVNQILIEPTSHPVSFPTHKREIVSRCAMAIRRARARQASIILMYGAHLIRNGAALIVDELMRAGWLTHVATNGAGSIHDWEYAWLGASTESVQDNVATGTFGAWDETGRYIHLALMMGGTNGEGYGEALGRFITQDGGAILPLEDLEARASAETASPHRTAWIELARMIREGYVNPGRNAVVHNWKHASILANAFRHGVTATVHPGLGYDIISCHPMFNGAVIGRAAELDFKLFGGAVDSLEGGVVLAVGSAVMAPQVFEKSLSCVHNIRFQQQRGPVRDFDIFVVDLQEGGNWDWSKGEPPKDNPAYYLRFCKSFSRMGGTMQYLQCDNVAFMHNLLHELHQTPE